MITVYIILAIICDYGYSNFPLSTLNWWSVIFSLMAIITWTIQMLEIYSVMGSMRKYPFTVFGPITWDLVITATITIAYSFL